MYKQKRFLPLLTAALLMLLAVLWAAWVQQGELLPQVGFRDAESGMPLELYRDESDGTLCLFLPAHMSGADVEITCPAGTEVSFTGFGSHLAEVPLETDVTMTIRGYLRSEDYSLRLLGLSAIPTVSIAAEDGILEYLHADKNNSRDVAVTIFQEDGTALYHGGAALSGRGNGSWEGTAKRPYNLTFSEGITFGPFQDISRLCLLAEYSDESKLRNALAYFAGQELGIPYASGYQYLNLYVNGEYLGLYGAVTKEEYKKHLVSDGIQAVFEITSGHNPQQFTSSLGWEIRVMQGDLFAVRDQVNALEEALSEKDWEESARLLDLSSFARKYALEEFLANLDLSYASQYFYLDRDNVIHCMLPWDYDWTLGSAFSYFNNRQAVELKAYRSYSSWYTMLLENPRFRQATADVLDREFTDEFLKSLDDHLEQSADQIRDSWKWDRLRWEYSQPYNQFDLSSGAETLEDFQVLFSDYFRQRRAFLADFLRNEENYCRISFMGARWGNLIIPKGEKLSDYIDGASLLDVNVPGERFLGWYNEKGQTPQDVDEVKKDLYFVGSYEELEVPSQHTLRDRAAELLQRHGLKLAVAVCFGLTGMGMFLQEWKQSRKKSAV